MIKPPALKDLPDLPDEIVQAGPSGELVLFVGAGMSMLLGLPSWQGMAKMALAELQGKELLDFSELEQLGQLSPRTQLSIAKQIADEAGQPLNLKSYLAKASEGSGIYKTINAIGCTCVTTNYDEMLSPQFYATNNGSTTPKAIVRISDREEFFARRLDEPGVVVHIHGSVGTPEKMVVTTRDYLEHYDHENLKHFLGELFAKKTVLFLGYGLEENELLEHILRRGAAKKTSDRRRFALQGFFRSQEPLYQKLYQYYQASFGVHLIGYVRDYKNYKQQEVILSAWAPSIKVSEAALDEDMTRMDEVLGNG